MQYVTENGITYKHLDDNTREVFSYYFHEFVEQIVDTTQSGWKLVLDNDLFPYQGVGAGFHAYFKKEASTVNDASAEAAAYADEDPFQPVDLEALGPDALANQVTEKLAANGQEVGKAELPEFVQPKRGRPKKQ